MNKFFVIINGGKGDTWSSNIWSDISDEAIIYLDNIITSNRLLKMLNKLHFSNKINSIINLPFKNVWKRLLPIQESDIAEFDNTYIIFQSNVKFPPKYLKYLKGKYGCKVILYLPDTVEKLGIAKNVDQFSRYVRKNCIDLCFSFDPKDCQKFDLIFFDIYSKVVYDCDNIVRNDLFYVGNCRNKNRLNILLNVFEACRNYVNSELYLFGVDLQQQKYSNKIRYNKYLPYNTVINKILSSNCILELVNENQIGNTLRFKEAICYNKKLLTTNKNVINSKYYNENYIRMFTNIDEIDKEWISKREKVDYGYSGEFSPKALLNMIEKLVNN
ncbi:hypothetical protein [Clostridium sp. BL-8]|uniref:hypothetical protein n=1 Tax=Clostridium sp. BL-8 TaxID=349938 RepID=UPI00098BDA1C|nr:hypothetical protein [Clostridium sp. BL-8]OOM80322.1 hypothetical protein CLOBL_09780 [Clostridium sp. BL-8]